MKVAFSPSETMDIQAASVLLLPEVEKYAQLGLIPAGTYHNREFRSYMIESWIAKRDASQSYLMLGPPKVGSSLCLSFRQKSGLGKRRDEGVERAIIAGVMAASEERVKIT